MPKDKWGVKRFERMKRYLQEILQGLDKYSRRRLNITSWKLLPFKAYVQSLERNALVSLVVFFYI